MHTWSEGVTRRTIPPDGRRDRADDSAFTSLRVVASVGFQWATEVSLPLDYITV